MNKPRVSGSIDLVVLGGIVAAGGYAFDVGIVTAVGIGVLLLGVVKVMYDHLTGFEDPLGIERSNDAGDNAGRGDQ